MNVKYTNNFEKKFKKLPQKLKDAFRARLKLFIQDKFNPLLNNHLLHGEYRNCRSINITGDLRAIFNEDRARNILFKAIGTHSQFYDK